MKKLNSSSYILIVIMAFMIAIIVASLRMEWLSAKLIPLVFASFVFILAVAQLVKEIVARGKAETVVGGETCTGEKSDETRRHLFVAAWILGLLVAIYLVGFVVSVPIFILCYMKRNGSRWLTAILSAIVFTAVIYFVFELALELPLYQGLFFE